MRQVLIGDRVWVYQEEIQGTVIGYDGMLYTIRLDDGREVQHQRRLILPVAWQI